MSDDEGRETKPFKFVTAGTYLPRLLFASELPYFGRSLVSISVQAPLPWDY
ncbi:hypothetical protein MMC19_007405 [Ptychographa xylographoides]|nr:hypothetical protein [Ptychographa xylographoides]